MAAAAILLPLAGLFWVSGVVPHVWYPFGPTGPGIPLAAVPGLLIVLGLVVLLPWTMARARHTADDTMAPLGSAITRLPSSVLLPRVGTGGVGHHTVGPTTFAGQRYGREVVVDAYSGSSAVLVAAATPRYTLHGGDGRLTPDAGTPAAVTGFVAALPADRRWNRASVDAGPDSIRVDRRGSTLDQGFLLDLWLAERLAEISARPSSPA